jgi:moderate conductance mechanosensitive channel
MIATWATWWEQFRTFAMSNLVDSIVAIVLTILVAALLLALVNWTAHKAVDRVIETEMEPDRRARLRTIISASKNTLRIAIWALAAMGILAGFGVDFGPILAAAGIAGLAISLGAQTIIKDFLGGLTILLEDQYRVGDSISVHGVDGAVERITLRRTNIRTADGTLFVVPNGDIRTVGNNTRDWSRATVELNLAYDGDITKAVAALNVAMAMAAEDPAIKPVLLEPPEILGWNQTNDVGVRVRLQAKVKPGQQWAVARQLRRLALSALQEAGVRIAQPYMQVPTAGTAK